MITPFDKPAQSQVIDFYQQLPWDQIMNVAMRKDQKYSDYLNKLDNYSTTIGNIETASDKDKQYLQDLKRSMDSHINDAVKGGVDLGDNYEARKFTQGLQSKIDVNALKNIQGTTSYYKDYVEHIGKLGDKYDKYMDEVPRDKEGKPIDIRQWESYKSSNGSWKGKAGVRLDYEKVLQDISNRAKDTDVILHDFQDGRFLHGFGEKQAQELASKNANTFSLMPEGKYAVESFKRRAAETNPSQLYKYDVDDKGSIIKDSIKLKTDEDIAYEMIHDRLPIRKQIGGSYIADRVYKMHQDKLENNNIPSWYNAVIREANKDKEHKFTINQDFLDDLARKNDKGEYLTEDVAKLNKGQLYLKGAQITEDGKKVSYIGADDKITKYKNYLTAIQGLDSDIARKKSIKLDYNTPGARAYTYSKQEQEHDAIRRNNLIKAATGLEMEIMNKYNIDPTSERDRELVRDKAKTENVLGALAIPDVGGLLVRPKKGEKQARFAGAINNGVIATDVEYVFKGTMDQLKSKVKKWAKDTNNKVYEDVSPEKLGFRQQAELDANNNPTGKTELVLDGVVPTHMSQLHTYKQNIRGLKSMNLDPTVKQRYQMARTFEETNVIDPVEIETGD